MKNEGRIGALGSRPDRAAPLGVTVKTRIEGGARAPAVVPYDLNITILEIVRGNEEGREQLRTAEATSGPLPAGFEYLLARIRFGYCCAARGRSEHTPYVLDRHQFVAASGDGSQEFDVPTPGWQPKLQIIGVSFSEGETKEGWVALSVPEIEREPLIVFHRELDNRYAVQGPVWLRAYQPDPMLLTGECGECIVRD